MRHSAIDRVGQRFGKLVVLRRVGTLRGQATWECRCDCSGVSVVQSGHLQSGDTNSCGCLRKPHGHRPKGYRSPTYYTWQAMKGRCRYPKHPAYAFYSTLHLCPRWKASFEAFLADMGERPEGMTIDRIDGSLGYMCGGECCHGITNCRWATWEQQRANHTRKP